MIHVRKSEILGTKLWKSLNSNLCTFKIPFIKESKSRFMWKTPKRGRKTRVE